MLLVFGLSQSAWAEDATEAAPARAATEQTEPWDAQAFQPSAIDRMQANLAQQNHTLDTLLEVVKKLEDLSKYDEAAKSLLATESESVVALQEALSVMDSKSDKDTNKTIVTPSAAIVADAMPEKHTSAGSATKTAAADFHAGQILYAQPSNHQRGTIAKVVIETAQQRFSLNQGQAMQVGTNHWLLMDVQPQSGSNHMQVLIQLNGQNRQVRYTAL